MIYYSYSIETMEVETMIYYSYSIKDTKAGAFGIPFFAQNDDLAKRQFMLAIRQGGAAMMNAFPADFELWKNGIFTDDVGTVNGNQPEYMMNGQDAKNIMEG